MNNLFQAGIQYIDSFHESIAEVSNVSLYVEVGHESGIDKNNNTIDGTDTLTIEEISNTINGCPPSKPRFFSTPLKTKNNIFKCTECSFSTQFRSNFTRHKAIHSNTKGSHT